MLIFGLWDTKLQHMLFLSSTRIINVHTYNVQDRRPHHGRKMKKQAPCMPEISCTTNYLESFMASENRSTISTHKKVQVPNKKLT